MLEICPTFGGGSISTIYFSKISFIHKEQIKVALKKKERDQKRI